MTLDPTTITIAIAGGFLAGIVNTLAGNGSAITLSIMTEIIGLPPNVANGTNRVGVLMQTLFSSASFIKNGKLDLSTSKKELTASIVGAIIGVIIAINVSNEFFHTVFKYLLVVMLLVVLVKPKRWLKKPQSIIPINSFWSLPMFFLLGIYGGFIQMGMGVIFLVVTVLLLKYDIIAANALKTGIVAAYTIIAVLIFHFSGLIDWKIGLIIGIGQAAGGYLTAEFASKSERAQLVAYVLLIVVIILAVLSSFGILAR